MELICSYLEIKAAFELLKLVQPNFDMFLIYGGTHQIKNINNCPYRYYFQGDALIKLQLNRPEQYSKIISSFKAISPGTDSDFIFIREKNCPLFFNIKKQRQNYPFLQRLVFESENQLQKASPKEQ